jgi:prephenate dehydrogenase
LFRNKKNIICEEALSDEDALSMTIEIFHTLEMNSLFMDPESHDRHMAYVSHLSHVSSFMLGSTVLDIEKDEKQIVNLASTGFESTVRLAKSSPTTWSTIFMDNKQHILPALRSYIDHLQHFEKAILEDDEQEMLKLITRSNEIKKVLSSMKHNIVKLS